MRKGLTTPEALRRGKECFEKQRTQIREEDGRFGLNYRFVGFGDAKAANMVRASYKGWGYKHNRWGSQNADFYVVAVHMLRAAEYQHSAPDCKHADHGKANHICEAFRVLDSVEDKPTEPSSVQGESEAEAGVGGFLDDFNDIPEEGAAPIPPSKPRNRRAKAKSWPSTAAPPATAATHPRTPGLGVKGVADILRDLANLHDGQAARVIHLHQWKDAVDIMVITAPQGDQAFRMFQQRLRSLGPHVHSDPAGQPSPKEWITVERLGNYFQFDVGPMGAACSDVLKNCGPWKPEEFTRDIPDFKRWQEAFHDQLRGGLLKNELAKRGLRFEKRLEDRSDGKPGKVVRNEYGEDLWFAEAAA